MDVRTDRVTVRAVLARIRFDKRVAVPRSRVFHVQQRAIEGRLAELSRHEFPEIMFGAD